MLLYALLRVGSPRVHALALAFLFPNAGYAAAWGVAVSGVLLVVIAVVLTRMGGRFRRELQR